MIKSKRTKTFYLTFVTIVILILFTLLFIELVKENSPKSNSFLEITILIILLLTPIIIAVQKFYRDSKIIIVDKSAKIISFEDFIFKKKIVYSFKNIDGYVTGRFISSNRQLTKVIWLVQKNKMIERINENYVANINEIENELKELKYLGYQSIHNMKRIKMIFTNQEIE